MSDMCVHHVYQDMVAQISPRRERPGFGSHTRSPMAAAIGPQPAGHLVEVLAEPRQTRPAIVVETIFFLSLPLLCVDINLDLRDCTDIEPFGGARMRVSTRS